MNVLSIHDENGGGNLGAECPAHGFDKECTAKSTTLESRVHGKAAHANSRNGWLTRGLASSVMRQVHQGDAGDCQGVIAGNALFFGDRNKAGGNATANVLTNLSTKITV